jgi:hypothetical protein
VLTRSFDSFSQAAAENAQSRIYLGIHWQFDAVEGLREGKAIADFVFAHALRPLHRGDHGGEEQGRQSDNPNVGVLPNLAPPSSAQASPTQTRNGAADPFKADNGSLLVPSPLLSTSDGGDVAVSPAPESLGATPVSNDPGRLLSADVLPGGAAKLTRRADVSEPDGGTGDRLLGSDGPFDVS